MKKNDFPTNPVAFAQYVWENIEIKDILVDRFRNFWKVTSYKICNGRKIRIEIRCIGDSGTDYKNGGCKKLTRYDLASKYYFYINNIAVKIPDVEDWDVKTFVQNYNTLWYILDTMVPITKEETTDMYALFLLTQEADKIYEEKNEKISTIRTLNELKNKFEKRDYYDGDKIREKCVNCLPKEDTKMTEIEKNYFLKNKEKTGADNQLKCGFYSQEDLDAAIEKIGDFLETHANTAKNTCKESVKKITDLSDEDLDRICTRVVDTFCDGVDKATDFSKKTLYDLKNWWRENHKDDEVKVKESKEESKTRTETVKVNNNQSVVTVDNNDMNTEMNKVGSIDNSIDNEDNLKLFPNLDKYFKNNTDTKNDDNEEVDFINRPFHIGDIVVLKNGYTGYISLISHTETFTYYYIPVYPIRNSTNNTKFKSVFGLETKLDPTLEDCIRVGDWNLSSDAVRTKLRKYEEFKNLTPHYTTDEKDNSTSTTNNTTPPPSTKTGNADSLPNYLSKLYLTDSAYSYEVNTKLTTDIVHKLNEVIEAIDDVILYNLNEIQEEERRRQLEER